MLIGIIVATLALAGFFFIKNSINKKAMEPCRPPRTDCLVLDPKATSYVPPEEEYSATTTPSGQIDEHLFIDNTLREVNFCGKMYQVRQVMIDGVDVMQRVAEILTKDLIPPTVKMGPYATTAEEWKTFNTKRGEMGKGICFNIQNSQYGHGSTLDVRFKGKSENLKIESRAEHAYSFAIDQEFFTVIIRTSDIYGYGNYEGVFIGPIGKLK